MTGSCLGSPRFSASRPIHAAIWAFVASSPGYGLGPPAPTAAAAASATPPLPLPAAWSTAAGAVGVTGGAAGGASPPTRMNLTLAMFTSRGTFMTWSWLLPSSAVNLPSWTLLARKPMCPSEPKSSPWPQS